MEPQSNTSSARLPSARGPSSRAVLELLDGHRPPFLAAVGSDDALGDDDLHLALYLCYELHYRGLPGVPDELEWDPGILSLRRELEAVFEAELLRSVPHRDLAADEVGDVLRAIARSSQEDELSAYIEREATPSQAREFLVHRSAYQLKEADPHSWVIPRLEGAAKTAVVEIQYDEYGSGDPSWMHSELFRTTMRAAGLDATYGAYLDRLPGISLAGVNLISLFGLHRRWRGALVGHLAAFEMTSVIPMRGYANGFRRLGFDDRATRFFDEHVEADSVHEILACDEAAAGLASAEPALAPDIVFGAEALGLLGKRASDLLLDPWREDRSSLRDPLPALVA